MNTTKQPFTLRHAGPDFAVLSVILVVLNGLVSPGDPGWLAVNPTPWLLIPLLLAVRYGFWSGVVSGGLLALLILLSRTVLLTGDLAAQFLDHRFVLAALPLAGALVGQLSESLKVRAVALSEENEALKDQNKLLHAEREVLSLSKQDLQQRLGLFGADAASLDEDLQTLVRSCPEAGPQSLLSILSRFGSLRCGAVYRADPQANPHTPFQRLATLGREDHFPATLQPRDHHVARAALEKNSLMTQRGLLQEVPTRDAGYLLAVPISGPKDTYLLVVQDIPFAEISMRTFTVIRTLCRWFEASVLNPITIPAGHKALDQEKFYRALENALATHVTQALPSTLVRIPFDAPADTPAFNRFLAELPHSGIVTNTIDHGRRSLLFLFPAISDPELAEKFKTAFGNFTSQIGLSMTEQPTIHLTTPEDSPQRLWGKLLGANG